MFQLDELKDVRHAVHVVVRLTCLEETSYLLWMTLQGTPATVTEFWMSSALWPRLEPEIVTTVPPSTGPDAGSTWNTGDRHDTLVQSVSEVGELPTLFNMLRLEEER